MAVIRIRVLEGENPGETTTFDAERIVMGRGSSNELVVKDAAISRQHAAIERVGEDFFLVDLGSVNGTFVRGQKDRVTRWQLVDGDVIALGKARLQVSLARPATESEATMVASRPTDLVPPPPPPPLPAANTPTLTNAKGVGVQKPSDLPIVLSVVSGPDRGMVFSPTTDMLTIGRLSTSDVPLNDSAVSRLHATIKREANGYAVYDEGSTYGVTMVNTGKRVFHEALKSGDRFRVGSTEILVEIGSGKGGEAEDPSKMTMSGTIGSRSFSMTLRGLRTRMVELGGGVDVGTDETAGTAFIEASATTAVPRPEVEAAPPPPADPRIVLRIVSGPDVGRSIEPDSGTARFTVGRSDKSNFIVNDGGISGVHFSITFADGEFTLRDEKSRNGVFVDKKPDRVTERKLRGGEVIRIGETDIKVEIIGAEPVAKPAVSLDSTMVVGGPTREPLPVPAPTPATPPAAKPDAKKPAVPELSRSREAKDRISKIMKGVSLRPIRRPGTPRQWAGVALVLFAILTSYFLPRTWVSAGPVFEGHAPIEAKCETCHTSGPSSFRLMSVVQSSTDTIDTSCVTADCHVKVLRVKEGVKDDCVFCHVEHRGRSFPIRGGENLCWSCHRGQQEPPSFDLRLMKVTVTRDKDLKALLEPKVERVEIGLKFSHSAHDKETKGDRRFDTCVGCHAEADAGRTFAMPSHAQCLECHEAVVSADTKKAEEKAGPDCLQCHTSANGEMAKVPPSPFGYVIFSHSDHQKEFCTSCHASVWEEGPYKSFVRTPGLYKVPMEACYTCHEQKGATIACLDCHREHHSFPAATEASIVPGGGGFDKWLIAMLVLTLGGAGYIYADMRVARRYLEPPPPPSAGTAPKGGAAQPADEAGEIMDFPAVDVEACISCGSCYGSCPKQVLAGDDHGKSTVVNPDSCIAKEGCAVCEQGCPTGAIRVSTAPLKRTVERPEIDEHNEAGKVPGLFFAGEVVGAALIKSAITQGVDCAKHIDEKKPKVADAPYDVIVVGAGPAGLGAALEAKRRKLKFLLLERGTVAQTIKDYPRDKAVLAEPVKMPLYGPLPMMDSQKETLIATWAAIVQTTGLAVSEHEEVTDVQRKGALIEVTTGKAKYQAANVVLAIGTRGDPRKLGCPGEAQDCVAYNLIDAADHAGKTVLVVGGGDSAIEAAVALASTPGTKCVVSYRKGAFSRVKKRNLEQIEAMAKSGQLEIVFNSSVAEVKPGVAVLKTESGTREVAAVQIFALIGADPPKGWIEKKLGVPFVMREEVVVTWS